MITLEQEYQNFLEDWGDEISFEDWLKLEIIHLRRALKTKDDIINKLIEQLPGN